MSTIGIIANPSSGKDIRRLVSHATTVDNSEKINIVERIVLAAQAFGVEKFIIMPDTYQIGYKVEDNLITLGELTSKISILNMTITGSMEDTVRAVEYMENEGVDCLIVLGGDGTSRAAAKALKDMPLISLSTGTNNVYPEMIEGTTAGVAAAVIACKKYDINKLCRKDKRIEIYKNGELIDIALIDAVISRNIVVGAKAIWEIEDILKIFVSRAHPASIGFSSIVGCKKIVNREDDFGICVDLTERKNKIMAAVAAGVIKTILMGDEEKIDLNKEYKFIAETNGTIALDGEREIIFRNGEEFIFKITRNGPLRVNINDTLELCGKNNFFKCDW